VALDPLHSNVIGVRGFYAANGANYWAYDGETMNERRARMEREAEDDDEA